MGASDRTVRHLHLRAPSAQAAVHAVHRLEEALRCASLPDTGERVLLVRRLQLGRLPAGLSSQSLSLLIEQRVAAVGGAWVHGNDERAAQCDTVFFASRLQAAQVALYRRAGGAALDTWYWPLALPGVAVRAPSGVFVVQLLDAVSRWREAAAALPALVCSVQAPAAQDWWQEHVPLAWQLRLSPVAPQALLPPGTSRVAPADAAGEEVDDRPGQGVAFTLAENAAVRDVRTDGSVAHLGDGRCPSERTMDGCRTTRETAGVDSEDPIGSTLPHAGIGRSLEASAAPVRERLTAWTSEAGEAVEPAWLVGPSMTEASGLPGEAHITEAAGLLFLWPLLERLGFAAWEADQPDMRLGPLVLRLALQRMGVPEADPAWTLLASLPAMPAISTLADEHTMRWLQACRRHARREWRIGLASLVLRPGWLQWNATHIDVHFRQRDADIRVRRAALDINPGWVEGLQRVVSFHYSHEGSLP